MKSLPAGCALDTAIPVESPGEPLEPPEQLYHGIPSKALGAVLLQGLAPVGRSLVHLSGTSEEALGLVRRRTDQPAVIRVHAGLAHQAGVSFYREGKVYWAATVPARFLAVEPLSGARLHDTGTT